MIDDAAPFDRDLAAFIAACAPWIDATSPAVLTDAYFQATLWRATDRTAAVTPYAVISRWQGRDAVYTRYCIDPSIPAALSLKPFRSVQAFSGTLPGRQPLGIPGDPRPLRFGSPFPAGHLGVFVVRDLSIVVADILPAEIIRGTILTAGRDLPAPLDALSFFDRYQGKGVPPGSVSLSVRLTFQAPDRTLTDAEVQHSVDAIVAALVREHAAVQR